MTFSESVTGVDTTDFALATTGGVSGTIASVTPVNGFVYTVTINAMIGSGTLGLNLVDNNTIRDAAGNPLMNLTSPLSFAAQTTFGIGTFPRSTATGDLNGDGKPDVVVANNDSNFVTVRLGNGDGTFASKPNVTTGFSPYSVVIADLNGDGKPDLIVANRSSDTVSVILGNGDGTFQTQVEFLAQDEPFYAAVSDVNGDGKLDIVAGNGVSDSVSVLLGNGNGTFQAQTTFSAGNNPIFVALSDLNGDGKPDIVAANYSSGTTASILLGNGDGTFQSPSSVTTGFKPISLALYDMNGDGRTDIVVANDGAESISVLLGNGNGTFQTHVTYAATDRPRSAVLGDVNGDGKIDVIYGTRASNNVGVLLGNGDGTLQSQLVFATGNIIRAVAVSDFNGDGRLDFTSSNFTPSSGSVRLNALNGDFAGQIYTVIGELIAPTVQSIARTNPATSTAIPPIVVFTATFSEAVTGVDVADFVLALSGVTGTIASVTPVSASVYTVIVNGIAGTGTLGLNLINNGTIHDLSGNTLTTAESGATFSPQVTFAAANGASSLTLADVNGDGKADAITTGFLDGIVGVQLSNGDGTYQPVSTFAVGGKPSSVAVMDVNSDTKADLVVTNFNDGTLSVLRGNGDGTFQAQTTVDAGVSPSDVVLADISGDGKPDALVASYGNSYLDILLGNGDGTFQPRTTVSTGGLQYSLKVADVNGDSKLDVVTANFSSNSISVLLGNGNGTFQTHTTIGVGVRPSSVDIGDVNGDGKPDVVTANYLGHNLSLLLGNGSGGFAPATTLAAGTIPVTVTLGDVNGDGKRDIVVDDFGGNTLNILLGNGNGSFATPSTVAIGTGSHTPVIADVNADGKADLVASNFFESTISVLLNTAPGQFTGEVYAIVNGVVELSFFPPAVALTPGQTAFASVYYQNIGPATAFPHSVKLYRSRDGVSRDSLLATQIVTTLASGAGKTINFSWIVKVADADADYNDDGTASSYLIAVIDEEGVSGQGTLRNLSASTTNDDYIVTVPVVSILPASPTGSVLTALEGQSSGKFVLTRTGDTTASLTVKVGYTGTASSADFIGGVFPSEFVTFLAGQTTASITLKPIVDTNSSASESAPESLTLTLLPDPSLPSSTPDRYTVAGTPQVMTIYDSVPTIAISVRDGNAAEKASNPATFRLTRTGPASQAVAVRVSFAGGAAQPGSDFVVSDGRRVITFASGVADVTIPANKRYVDLKLTPVNDVLIEGNESIVPVILPDPDATPLVRYVVGAPSTATATLVDNDGQSNLSAAIAGTSQRFVSPTNQGTKALRLAMRFSNTTNFDASATTYELRLISGAGTSANFDASAISLGTVQIGAIRARATITRAFTVRLSSLGAIPPGTYRVGVKLDSVNAVTELNEADNYAFTGQIVTVV